MMKTITYRGEQYEVEDWVNFVAMELDGAIFGFEKLPFASEGEWLPNGGRFVEIHREITNWEESLEKV